MTDHLEELKALPDRWVVGLNSGTSLDGVDAALMRISGYGFDVRFSQHHFKTSPFPDRVKARLAEMNDMNPAAVADLNYELGEIFAAAALQVVHEGGLSPGELHLIGSHGLTVSHRPPRRRGQRGATLQLGEIAVIAERCGCPVVGDFRAADVAAGGQGAPLMPYLDYLLFRDRPGTLLVNLGGIANLTYVTAELEAVKAFDTGPANLPLNQLMRRLTQGESDFDAEGRTAAMGHVESILLDQLMNLPYIHEAPPKSTGREEFGEDWVDRLLECNDHLKLVNILATLTAFSAQALKSAHDEWIAPEPVHRVIVSGGGVHNLTLMNAIRKCFEPIPVDTLLDHGWDPDAKEALLFGILANDRLFGRPTSLPSVTGAKWPVSLGKWAF